MYTTTRIRQYIFTLPPRRMFTTRDVLHCGKRSAVDQCLHMLIKNGMIIRLARGVFMRPVADSDLPSRAQIAVVKARAFGRRIINQSIAFARQLGLVEHDENKPTSPPPFALQNFSTCDYKVEEALDSNAALETEAALVEREHCNKAAKSSYCINSGTSSIGTKRAASIIFSSVPERCCSPSRLQAERSALSGV